MEEHETNPAPKRRCLRKHTIFLSHSGKEKAFAEQLCEDLKRMNHYPFFDQDSGSLPKGDKFAAKILSAAEECLLGVVVLSEGYLSSKWPMLELSTFVKSRKAANPDLKLLPVFYKLSPGDLCAKKVETVWRASWEKLVEEGKVSAEEIGSWSDAVRELRAFNGVEFSRYGTSEVRYRAAVVDAICNNVPPMMKYKTDDIRGCERLCEVTSRMFEEGTSEDITCTEGCYYLGIYGLGGVGKSTLCKAMCSYFQAQYGMRVCHVELASDAEEEQIAEKNRLSRLKFVIQQFTSFDTRIVDRIASEPQGLDCLENGLSGQPAVFIAVDNVGDSESSRDEARGLVKSVLASGSKVMVTSRSRAILKSIFYTEKYCKPISRLEVHEARELFLSVAAPRKLLCPLQSCEDEIVEACLAECRFAEVGYAARQYHPLALRALGSYFYDVDEEDIMKWKEYVSIKNKLQGTRESQRVNDILGLNYSSLVDSEKLVFLDVALLINVRYESILGMRYVDSMGFANGLKDYECRVSFIATLHGLPRLVVDTKVKKLQRKSLMYEANPTLEMHDLYMEFAQSLVMKDGNREREWWVHRKNWAYGMNFGLMKRLCLLGGEAKIFRDFELLRQCEKLEGLVMVDCYIPKDLTLDLGRLRSLRVLILSNLWNSSGMLEIVCNCEGEDDEGCLPELRLVQLIGRLVEVPFLKHCYNLRSLNMYIRKGNLGDRIHSGDSKIFEKLKTLELLRLSYCMDATKLDLEGISKTLSSFQFLKKLHLDLNSSYIWPAELPIARRIDVSLLGRLPSLSTLALSILNVATHEYGEVPFVMQGFEQLFGLTKLELYCPFITEFEGVDQLSKLTILDMFLCRSLCILPDLDHLQNLQAICIHGCSLHGDFKHQGKLESYQKITGHIDHECRQPFCNKKDCKICLNRWDLV